jgi:hypothetical protein
MKHKILSLSCLIAAGSLLMGMTALTTASPAHAASPALQQASPLPGMAIGNGSVFQVGSRLTIFSSMASRLGNYTGSVYVYGLTQGKVVSINTPVYNPVFSGDATTSTCKASNNITFAAVSAKLVWTWNQNLNGTAPSTFSWTVTAYKPGDIPGSPTGNVLSSSGLMQLNGGQIVVTQPQAAVVTQPM